jgi:hypothetical protein
MEEAMGHVNPCPAFSKLNTDDCVFPERYPVDGDVGSIGSVGATGVDVSSIHSLDLATISQG